MNPTLPISLPIRRLLWAAAGLALAAMPPARTSGAPAPAPVPAKADTEQEGLLHLGTTLTTRGDYDTAEIAFWQILNGPDASPADKKSALLGLAHLHRRQGSPDQSHGHLRKIREGLPR